MTRPTYLTFESLEKQAANFHQKLVDGAAKLAGDPSLADTFRNLDRRHH